VPPAPPASSSTGRLVASLTLGMLALGALASDRSASARGGGQKNPVGETIRDAATTVSVPLNDTLSLVVGLPERFWVQCPRVLPVPTSLAGRGLIVQYMNARAGSTSMLYLGVVPLPPAVDGLTLEQRTQNGASDFAVGLAKAYDAVDWELFSGPVAVAPANIKVDGKKTPAWRTKRYSTRPKDYGGPDSVFTCECVMFVPLGQAAGAEQLVYVALDAKAGGTTLEKVIEQLSVKPTRLAHPAARRLQLNDLFASAEADRFPVRQISFDLPAGFAPTLAMFALKGEWVYVEEHLDAEGRPDARLEIRQRLADKGSPPTADAEKERSNLSKEGMGAIEEVPLAVAGQKGLAFSHAPTLEGAKAASTAVVRVDDMTLILTLSTLTDAAAAPADHAKLVTLLKSLDYAVRW
jgi:hypothetical protein